MKNFFEKMFSAPNAEVPPSDGGRFMAVPERHGEGNDLNSEGKNIENEIRSIEEKIRIFREGGDIGNYDINHLIGRLENLKAGQEKNQQ